MGRKESNQTNKQTKIRPDVLSDGSDTLTGKVAITNQLIYIKQEISLKKIFGGSQILTILTQLSDEIPLYSLSLHAGKGCSV